MSGPREAFAHVGHQRVDDQPASQCAGDDGGLRRVRQQRIARFVQIAQRGGEAPAAHRRRECAQPREAQLQQHAALVAQQFVPFVDHHAAQRAEQRGAVVVGQQQRQRFGSNHQRIEFAGARQALVARAGVAGTHAHGPAQTQRVDRFAQRAHGVGGQRAQRRHPQQFRAGAADRAVVVAQRFQQRPAECGQGFAAAGGGVNQSAFAGEIAFPDFTLKRQRRPATRFEPVAQRAFGFGLVACGRTRRCGCGL